MLSKHEPGTHFEVVRSHFKRLHKAIQDAGIEINGNSLTIAEVVAASKLGCRPYLTNDKATLDGIEESVQTLKECLANGEPIYGVNTGFGGRADSRTDMVITLQKALCQLLQAGILTSRDCGSGTDPSQTVLSHSMPSDWVKGMMLVRCNSVARGHSAVSLPAIEAVLRLLQNDIVPVIPLRGTISASGDLMPLAYIVGAIEGNPGVHVRIGRQICTADQMLRMIAAPAVALGPKEGLGLVNGTAASAALASLVIHEGHQLALLSQIITALTVEALRGSVESFHPFIAETRPHDGQGEVSANILSILQGSKLVQDRSRVDAPVPMVSGAQQRSKNGQLIQDRYALRTASQWIGPQLEDLLLADRQVAVELNSTSDNPLIDCESRAIHSGGNFQATSITSAMEKTRLVLQMLGKLLFAQCTEMIDLNFNNGLPCNLVADDPSLSFTMKGVDISMAAYMAELAYLANPVSSHVQTAEMHNQAVNSMAFVAARYSMHAVDIVAMMAACSLYVACQALDLRVLQVVFLEALEAVWSQTLHAALGDFLSPTEVKDLAQILHGAGTVSWTGQSKLDLDERCHRVVDACLPTLVDGLARSSIAAQQPYPDFMAAMQNWRATAAAKLKETYEQVLAGFHKSPNTVDYLGVGSIKVYRAVREQLRIPFHCGLIEHPTIDDLSSATVKGREKKTVGGWISVIYEALRDQKLASTIIDAFLT